MNVKRIFASVLLFFTFSFAAEDSFSIEFEYETTFLSAQQKALAVNKPMMILFITASCPWCQKLKHQVLSKDEISGLVQNTFIPVMIDKESDYFPEHLMPFAVPTLTFIDPKTQQPFFKIIGYKPLEEATKLFQEAKRKAKEHQ